MAFDAYVSSGALDGIAILRGGKIVYESYPRMGRSDQHILFSVSKVMVSTVVAILEDRGLVDVSKPVAIYVPGLRQTAWEGIPVQDVLDMASGIDALEAKSRTATPTALRNVIKSDHAPVPASQRTVSLQRVLKPEPSSPQA